MASADLQKFLDELRARLSIFGVGGGVRGVALGFVFIPILRKFGA